MRWVACLSLCGFYANVARRRGDLAAALPVVVMQSGAALDGDRSAYALGLRPGSPARQVRRTCPGAVLVEYEEKEYLSAAEDFWRVCLSHTPLVEPGAGGAVDRPALHRVCLGVPTPVEHPPRGEVAALLQALVPAFGFAAAAGIGSNKLVAGAAAQWQRDSLLGLAGDRRGAVAAGGNLPLVVAPEQEAAFLARLPLEYLWPAVEPERRRLAELGLSRIGEVAAVPGAELLRQFGPRGQTLHRWSRGIDPEPVRATWPPRTVTARLAFPTPRADAGTLAAALARLATDLAAALQRRDEVCQQASLQVELTDGGQRCAERTFSRPQSSPYYIEQSLLALLRQLLAVPAPSVAATGADVEGQTPSSPAVAVLEASLGCLGPVARRQASLLAEFPMGAGVPPMAPAGVAVSATTAVPAAVALVPSVAIPDPERAARLEFTLAALQERYPSHLVRLGMSGVTSRREAMLTLYDPYRWTSGKEGAGPWPGSLASR